MLISSPDCAPLQSISPDTGACVAGASVAGISVAGASVAGISVAGASVAGGGWVAAGVCVAPPQAANNKLVTARMVMIFVILYISSFSIKFLNTTVAKA
jgi:hypothetical protein